MLITDSIAKVNDRIVQKNVIEIIDQQDDTHNQYMNILGRDYEKECRINPYEKKNINEVSNRTSPSPLFRIKKGYC